MLDRAKKILYVDMDGVLCDFDKKYVEIKKVSPKLEFPQSLEGFFLNLEPMWDAISSVNKLRKKYNVLILTSPSHMNPHCYTEKRMWIEQWFDMEMARNLIITKHKFLNKGDYLIDDRPDSNGNDLFEGELIHFGSKKFPDWKTVVKYLK